ncbi:TetR/AcrR family transcriptional regulator [Stenotrophomonas sp. 364]|uniref:TetR/AcrR family transcriptional regulator n=1 Tax=Stenotrophomonas sp. 364 TaxID=2691571 RepID=UPI001F159D4A|nr:TetR/AcrR family transcriptional regulator [Stenotrophomonas sp. 364]
MFPASSNPRAREWRAPSLDPGGAQQAGCSKQTLYSRYGSKQELLRRVMQRHVSRATAGLHSLDKGDLRGSLLQFASDYLDHCNQPHAAQARRFIA